MSQLHKLNMKSLNISTTHPYHIVDISPWPFVASMACLYFTLGTTMTFHGYFFGTFLNFIGFISILFVMFVWWRDIVREAVFEGKHTFEVQKGLRLGMFLFIISEVMFFFAFFWAFFHSALSPTPEIGSVWPPQGIETINAWEIPLLNTIILLTSGATLTWTHHSLVSRITQETNNGFLVTIFLAFFFTLLQLFEYIDSKFTLSDGIYGSVFYLATGFHGLHVIIGTLFIVVCLFRFLKKHFTDKHHFGFEAAAWYWHFVDVVWLFLFITIYWWGNSL